MLRGARNKRLVMCLRQAGVSVPGLTIQRRAFTSGLSTISVAKEDKGPDRDDSQNEIGSVELCDRSVKINWRSNPAEDSSRFNYVWLLDNCPSWTTQSNQKKYRDVSSFIGVKAKEAHVSQDGLSLQIKWDNDANQVSTFPASLLSKTSCSSSYFKKLSDHLSATNQRRELVNIPFTNIFENGNQYNEKTFFDVLEALNRFGVVVVKNCPQEEATVLKFSKLIGEPSHKIYGEFFDVRSELNPINVAYTSDKLEFHQDFAYYESPPGIQMLHALEFSPRIKGGESLFIDSLAVAEELQISRPDVFNVLTKVAASFRKDHSKRDNPLKMYFQRPHIQVNSFNQVISVFWSPPFEGPLLYPSDHDDGEMIDKYYEAYGVFQSMINSKEMLEKHGYEFRLGEGDCVIFNNRRMLHARNAFENVQGDGKNEVRHLQGCYNDIDTFLNRYRLLAEKYQEASPDDRCVATFNENRQGINNFR